MTSLSTASRLAVEIPLGTSDDAPYKERIRYTLCIHCNQPTPWNAHLHSFDRKKLLSYFPESTLRHAYRFGSKVLVVARAPKVFSSLPLWIWRLFDAIAIKLTDKAQHIVVVVEK